MPPVDPTKVKTYPMVWKNEFNGKPAFMVHNFIVQKIFVKTSLDSEERIIDDVDEVRAFLFPFSRKMLEPESILLAPYEEGDIAVWNNRVCDNEDCREIQVLWKLMISSACNTPSSSIQSRMARARCTKSISQPPAHHLQWPPRVSTYRILNTEPNFFDLRSSIIAIFVFTPALVNVSQF